MEGRYVAYYRVSTPKQGQSGLGLEAQQEAVRQFLNGGKWNLLEEFTEVETGKGSNALDKRPVLKKAIALAKKKKATLLIAKLDRLARNVHFVSGLMESGTPFIAVDMPQADKTMLQIYSTMAEWERDRISQRVKDMWASKRARGDRIGNPSSLKPQNEVRAKKATDFALELSTTVQAFKSSGMTQRAMVDELNKLGIKTARGGEWSLIQLQRVLKRLDVNKATSAINCPKT